jgi:flagellar assembly factor FliW
MKISGTRFGVIEFDETRTITIPRGLVGFSEETRFILLEPGPGRTVAWLQSLITPELAFPVVAGEAFADDYPSPSAAELGRKARLTHAPGNRFSVLVVVASAPTTGRIANLLAPIIVNVDTLMAAQVVLDPEMYSAAEPFQGDRPTVPTPEPLYSNTESRPRSSAARP